MQLHLQLLQNALRRLPAGHRPIQEAFSTDHHRPVFLKLNELRPDTFYLLDDISARALGDAVVELAAHHGSGRLTIVYPYVGELQAQQHRLQLLAGKLERIRVLAIGQRSGPATHGIELHDTADSVLSQYRISLKEGPRPIVFIGREVTRVRATEAPRYLGFFSYDSETVAEIADDIELLIRKLTSRMATFEKLALLHQTTQRVTRELESYSRRMDIAIRRARRHPELLTPARFERIVAQAIAKMEELKEIPRRALRSLEKPRR